MDDRQALTDTVLRYGRCIDDRDWEGLAGLFAERVDLDFTSLWSGQPETLSGAELTARWMRMGEALNATQHLVAGILPTIDGDAATVASNLVAVHRRAGAPGGSLWTVGGTYEFRLARDGGRWAIHRLTLRVAWVEGNQAVVGGA